MSARPPRRSRAAIAFMILWLVVWLAGIFVVLWALGGGILDGDYAAIPFLAIWLVGAGFGLYFGARRLVRLVTEGRDVGRPVPGHRWEDGIGDEGPVRRE